MINSDSDTDTISYGDESTDTESNYYSHSEPEFIEDYYSDADSGSGSHNSEEDTKVNIIHSKNHTFQNLKPLLS